jgi:hypothetical protein
MSATSRSEWQKRAQRIYPRARIVGDGPEMVLTTCSMVTIRLFHDKEAAAAAHRKMQHAGYTCLGQWKEEWSFHPDEKTDFGAAVMPGGGDDSDPR